MAHAMQSYLAGEWQMVRIIENVAAGVIGEVWGEAQFSPDGHGLACAEAGVLRFQGTDYHTARASLWRFSDQGRIEVRYADGRPFHDFLTDDPIALAIEGDATYRIEYDFGPGQWQSAWRMEGPGADYRMTTRYWRPRSV